MENRNHAPHGYEWRYHLMPGQPRPNTKWAAFENHAMDSSLRGHL